MQAAGAGAEIERALPAIPKTGATVDALFAVEGRDGSVAAGDGLAGAHLRAEFVGTAGAEGGIGEADVVFEAGRGLNFAAHQKGVLVGNEELTILGDFGERG